MPLDSSSSTISPSACAPVASRTCIWERRRITILTSLTAVQLREEPLRRTEEQRAVQSVDHDVLVKEPSFVGVGDGLVERSVARCSASAVAGHVTHGQNHGDGDTDLDRDDRGRTRSLHDRSEHQHDGI